MAAPLDLASMVLMTLASAGVVLMAVRPAFGRRYGGLVALTVVAGALVAVLAGRLPAAAAVAVSALVLVFWLVDRGIPLNRRRPGWLVVLTWVTVLGALAATVVALLSSPNVQ